MKRLALAFFAVSFAVQAQQSPSTTQYVVNGQTINSPTYRPGYDPRFDYLGAQYESTGSTITPNEAVATYEAANSELKRTDPERFALERSRVFAASQMAMMSQAQREQWNTYQAQVEELRVAAIHNPSLTAAYESFKHTGNPNASVVPTPVISNYEKTLMERSNDPAAPWMKEFKPVDIDKVLSNVKPGNENDDYAIRSALEKKYGANWYNAWKDLNNPNNPKNLDVSPEVKAIQEDAASAGAIYSTWLAAHPQSAAASTKPNYDTLSLELGRDPVTARLRAEAAAELGQQNNSAILEKKKAVQSRIK